MQVLQHPLHEKLRHGVTVSRSQNCSEEPWPYTDLFSLLWYAGLICSLCPRYDSERRAGGGCAMLDSFVWARYRALRVTPHLAGAEFLGYLGLLAKVAVKHFSLVTKVSSVVPPEVSSRVSQSPRSGAPTPWACTHIIRRRSAQRRLRARRIPILDSGDATWHC